MKEFLEEYGLFRGLEDFNTGKFCLRRRIAE